MDYVFHTGTPRSHSRTRHRDARERPPRSACTYARVRALRVCTRRGVSRALVRTVRMRVCFSPCVCARGVRVRARAQRTHVTHARTRTRRQNTRIARARTPRGTAAAARIRACLATGVQVPPWCAHTRPPHTPPPAGQYLARYIVRQCA
jgi:hypothetical protein